MEEKVKDAQMRIEAIIQELECYEITVHSLEIKHKKSTANNSMIPKITLMVSFNND